MRARVLFGACLAVAMVGCGGGDDDGDGSLTPEQAGLQVAEAICDGLGACFGAYAGDYYVGGACEAEYGAMLVDGWFGQIEREVEAGTVDFDAQQMSVCLQDIRDAGCTDLWYLAMWDSCEAAFVGQVELGGACSIDSQCAGAARCDLSATCPGVCVALAELGGSCTTTAECAEGVCLGGTCSAPRQNGQTCARDLDCASNFCPDGVCEAVPAVGTPCVPEVDDCGYFQVCLDVDGTGATCRPYADFFSGELGEACGETFCKAGLVCEVTSRDAYAFTAECVKPEAQPGGACRYAYPEPCPSGHFCDYDPQTLDGTCEALPRTGQACLEGACAPGHACDQAYTCREVQRLGGACTADQVCYSGACEGGVCVVPVCEDGAIF